MRWVKEIAGVLLFLAIAEGFPYLIIANADGDPLEAIHNVIRGLTLGFGIYAYVSYQTAKDLDRVVKQLNVRLERHDEQIKKLQDRD